MSETRLPLEGVHILDLSWYGAGPIGVKVLGDLGAEVVHLESANRLDGLRQVGPKAPGQEGSVNTSSYFNNFNSSKKGITLNLNHPKARPLFEKLVAWADVVVANFTPDTMRRWGLSYEELRRVKPDIILVLLPAVGMEGPRSHYRGFGTGIKSIAGLDYITHHPGRPPHGPPGAYPDYVINCGHGAIAIMAALIHKRLTGEGQYIEVAQYESTVNAADTVVLEYTVNGRIQEARGNRLPYAAPHGVYRCLGDGGATSSGQDRWCAIAVFNDEQWQALCEVMGDPEWAEDPRFATLQGRKAYEDELDSLVTEWTSQRTAEEVMFLLQEAGVPAGILQTNQDLQDRDPHLRARGYYVYLDHPETGRAAYDNVPFVLSGIPRTLRAPAPLLGQHNVEVYREIVGLSEEEIAQLVAEQVIY